jgi:hypothetical protein
MVELTPITQRLMVIAILAIVLVSLIINFEAGSPLAAAAVTGFFALMKGN